MADDQVHEFDVEHAPPSDDDEEADAVHDVLKRTDVWFSYRATALDREAIDLATKHAEKGQPRHDLQRDGPLEMELMLEQQAKEVLWGWADRVKRKMQGAIGLETERVGTGLADARQAVANAEAAHSAMEQQRSALGDQAEAAHSASHMGRADTAEDAAAAEVIECERHMPGRWFWPLMCLLVLADFFANVPVFTELFPANKLVDSAFRQWEEQILSSGQLPSWFGMAHLLKRVTVYPEPSILALVVVLVFMALGHTLGGSLRSLVVLWRHRKDVSKHSIGGFYRQSGWPAGLAVVGIALTVSVLYFARAGVLEMATERLAAAQAELVAVQKQVADSQAAGAMVSPEVFTREAEALGNITARTERVDYARAIRGINFPILLLNCVLVIVAIVAGYLREKRSFSVTPRSVTKLNEVDEAHAQRLRENAEQMRERLSVLRSEFTNRRSAAHEALRTSGNAILRVEHLFGAALLRDWNGKAERLRRAIPIFRTENARQRSLDVEDILAFRSTVEMRLPTTDQLAFALERPSVLDTYLEEYSHLQQRLHELDLAVPGDLIPMIAVPSTVNSPSYRNRNAVN